MGSPSHRRSSQDRCPRRHVPAGFFEFPPKSPRSRIPQTPPSPRAEMTDQTPGSLPLIDPHFRQQTTPPRHDSSASLSELHHKRLAIRCQTSAVAPPLRERPQIQGRIDCQFLFYPPGNGGPDTRLSGVPNERISAKRPQNGGAFIRTRRRTGKREAGKDRQSGETNGNGETAFGENLRRNSSKYLGKLCRLVRQCRLHKDCRWHSRADAGAGKHRGPTTARTPAPVPWLLAGLTWCTGWSHSSLCRRLGLSGSAASALVALVGRRLPGPADRARTVESDRRPSPGTARRYPLGGQRADRKR